MAANVRNFRFVWKVYRDDADTGQEPKRHRCSRKRIPRTWLFFCSSFLPSSVGSFFF